MNLLKSLPLAALLFAAPALPAAPTTSPLDLATTYQNPFTVTTADPYVLQDGNTYYLYGTMTPNVGTEVYTSDDLVHWRYHGVCYRPAEGDWADQHFWAPEVVKQDNDYFMYLTGRNSREDLRNIIVLKSGSPLGPFTQAAAPLFPGISVIDAHVYQDPETSTSFVYATNERKTPSTILGAALTTGMTELATSPTIIMTAEAGWEDYWNEAPFIIRHKDLYYMLYSGSAWWEPAYAVGYATAPTPLGPYTKFSGNPILKKTYQMQGPGHNSLAWSPDGTELFTLYHVHAGPWTTERRLAIDRARFIASGTTEPDILSFPTAPTHLPQPIPSGAPPRPRAVTDHFDQPQLDLGRWTIVNENRRRWQFADNGLTITMSPGDFWRSHENGQNVFLQHAPAGNYAISTKVDLVGDRNQEQAFLVIWDDTDNYVMLTASHVDENRIGVSVEIEQKFENTLHPHTEGFPLHLRIERKDTSYTFFTSADGSNWRQLGQSVTVDKLIGKFVGLGAWSPGSRREMPASFDFFQVDLKP